MKIDRETLNKIAHLSRLELDEKEVEKTMRDMSAIVEWVEKLREVDTKGLEPLVSMSHEVNAFREDEIKEHLSREQALANAPKKDDQFFRVPKVIE